MTQGGRSRSAEFVRVRAERVADIGMCSRLQRRRPDAIASRQATPGLDRGKIRAGPLDRIHRIDRTHIAGSIDPVNPVTTYKVEQIQAVDWDRQRRFPSTPICSVGESGWQSGARGRRKGLNGAAHRAGAAAKNLSR